ncbi:MAG: hypothetical protein LUG83_08960, partial [Lachnospiraceae bacterium]|nr:hypothetical protein [Lachnospiraceae bacterium]
MEKYRSLKRSAKMPGQSKPHKKLSRSKRRVQVRSGMFIMPSLMGVLLFFLLPFGVVIYYSMVDNPI